MKPILWTTCLLCILTIHGWSQQRVARYDPGLKNSFLNGYTVNDSTYRVFSRSVDGNNNWYNSFVVTDFIHGEPHFRHYNIDSFGTPLTGTYELSVIAFPSGDAFLAGNFFDCDFGAFGIMKMTADYQIQWHLNSYDFGSGAYKITHVGMVAPDVVALETDFGEVFYVSLDGEIVDYTIPPPVYQHPIFTTQDIFGFRNGQCFRLTYQFQILDSLAIDSALFVAPIGNDIIIQANDKLLLLSPDLDIIAESNLLPEVKTAVQTGDQIGVGNQFSFLVLDSALNINYTFLPMPFERVNFLMASGDTAHVLSTYNGLNHSDFISRNYIPGQNITSPSPDLRLSYVDIPDTVFVYNWDDPLWQFGIGVFEIENLSDDTIQDFRLECNWIPFGLMCSNYDRAWVYNSVNLLPGEIRTFNLDSFTAELPIGHHSPFCFWIESANGFPDPDPNNNGACDEARIVTAIDDLQYGKVGVSPNPASSECFITGLTGDGNKWWIAFYSLQGILVKSMILTSIHDAIPIGDLPEGMHIIHAIDRHGLRAIAKLIIQR